MRASALSEFLGEDAEAFRSQLREEAPPPRRRPPAGPPASVQEHARALRSGARMSRAELLDGLGLSESEARALGLEARR
jgi:hypothetical protein